MECENRHGLAPAGDSDNTSPLLPTESCPGVREVKVPQICSAKSMLPAQRPLQTAFLLPCSARGVTGNRFPGYFKTFMGKSDGKFTHVFHELFEVYCILYQQYGAITSIKQNRFAHEMNFLVFPTSYSMFGGKLNPLYTFLCVFS